MLFKGLMDMFMHLLKDNEKRIPGLFKSVSKVSRDFNSYSHFTDIISSHLVKKPSQLQAVKMVQEIIQIESKVVDDVLGLMGSNLTLGNVQIDARVVKERLKWHGDNCLVNLGYSPVFKSKDPLPWIEPILKKEAALEDGEHTLTRVIATPKKTPKKTMETELFKLDEDF
jgi:ribonucleotide reductase beta subunit family protein with ferritin-like domain